jgi:hypothetical protein
MQTYPSSVTIKPIANYYGEVSGVTITVSKRSGGIGRDDYLVAATSGFFATRRTRERAIQTATCELAQLEREAEAA